MKLISLVLLIAATLHGSAQERFPVTPQQVAEALLRRGFPVGDEQVSLVASIVASSADPQLEVESIQEVGTSTDASALRARVKIVCARPHGCVPFYALVSWPPGVRHPALDRADGTHLSPPPIAMRAGSSATLIVDSAQMHLRLPVISLQNGAVGSSIRVTSPDRKQTYTAIVRSATLLSGSL